MASLDKWDEYTKAKEAMFFHTDTADAPWTVIKSDCKKRARLNAMRYVLHTLPYASKDLDAHRPARPAAGRPRARGLRARRKERGAAAVARRGRWPSLPAPATDWRPAGTVPVMDGASAAHGGATLR